SSCPFEKNTSGLIVCLFGSGRWNRNCCGLRAGDRRRGTKSSACRFQFWRCSNEQREVHRRSASGDGLGIAQADRQALERESGKGAAVGSVKTRSGEVA